MRGTDDLSELSLVTLLRDFAARMPDRRAFVCLGEGNVEAEVLTYAALDRRAQALAAELLGMAGPGERALLIFPTCLAFVVAFFACLYAGIVAVPVVTPRSRRLRESALSVARDCQPKLALTLSEYVEPARRQFGELPQLGDMRFIAVNELDPAKEASVAPLQPADDPLLFLQYTSGSTAAPKGVMVSRRNLATNLEMMRIAFANDADSTYVGWAPLFHDMGLIANVLEPFYIGALCVLMSPALFSQQPWLWLKAVSDYRARVSGGPNFAYDLCVDRSGLTLRQELDLSCWRLAFNSAEPVRAATIEAFSRVFAPAGFRPDAFYPCYGMADATLLISGGPPFRAPVIQGISKAALSEGRIEPSGTPADETLAVGCGRALIREEIRIIDPATLLPLGERRVGEIWVNGPHIPKGYWGKPVASEETFRAVTAGSVGPFFLRSGDLGFLDQGELYITGRLKDVIILRGRNYYPQDVERIAESAWPGLRRASAAAFAVLRDDQQEIVLVQEVERVSRRAINYWQAVAAIRKAVFDEFELTLNDVVLIAPGAIPKTSSGKIKRAETRRRYLEGSLEPISAAAKREHTRSAG